MRSSQGSEHHRGAIAVALILAVCTPVLSGCKVVTLAADRASRERLAAAFDADRYVDAVWSTQAEPYWSKAAKPFATVAADVEKNPDAAGALYGRRSGEGSPWVFVVTAEGRVSAIGSGRAGRVSLVAARPGGGDQQIDLQVGPVVSGTALRDSLPFITFNDFANQIDFAEVGAALTRRAVTPVGVVARDLKVGDHVRFTGVAPLTGGDEPWVVTPIRLLRVGA